MERTIKRGDIFYADLNPIVGSEQGGRRPVLIVLFGKLNDAFCVTLNVAILC